MKDRDRSEHFCALELDEKGFNLILEYIEKCKMQEDFFRLDAKIQLREIEAHVYRHWMDKNADLHWIEEHAKKFRRYLNSIKVLWAAHVLEHGNDSKFDHAEYCRLVKNWPNVKEVLEDIF